MKTKTFTSKEIKDLKIDAIARKYKCSNTYVREVMKGDKERNTELSQKIMKDAIDIYEILQRETLIEA